MNKSILKIIVVPVTLFLMFMLVNNKAMASEATGTLSTNIDGTTIVAGGGGGGGGGGGSSGSTVYACRDPKALNYGYYGLSNPSLCKYGNTSTTTISGGSSGANPAFYGTNPTFGNNQPTGNPVTGGTAVTTGATSTGVALGPTQATSTINSLLAAIAASGFPSYNELLGFSIFLLLLLIILLILWLIKRKTEDSEA